MIERITEWLGLVWQRLMQPGPARGSLHAQAGFWGAVAAIGSAYFASQSAGDAADAQAGAADAATAEQRRQFNLIRGDTEPYRQVGRNALYAQSEMLGLGSREYHERQNRLSNLREDLEETDKFNVSGGYWETKDDPNYVPGDKGPSRVRSRWVPNEKERNPEYFQLQDEISDLEAQIEQTGGGPGESEPFDVSQIPGYQFRFDQGTNALNRSLAASGNRFSGRAMKAAQRYGQGIASQEYGQHFNRLAGVAGTGQAAVGTSGQAGMQAAGNIGQAQMAAGQAQAQGIANQNRAIQGGIGNFLSYRQNQQLLNQLGNQGGGMPNYTGSGGYGFQAGG